MKASVVELTCSKATLFCPRQCVQRQPSGRLLIPDLCSFHSWVANKRGGSSGTHFIMTYLHSNVENVFFKVKPYIIWTVS